ncbi:hypothetical protein HDV64DRAFT_271132 [Trichoderma sp. TUCIM 5745]
MAEANSSMNIRAVQIRAPPSLTSCVDIVDRATAPYHNERPTRGAIIAFDFKYPSNIFFVENEPTPKFHLNFTIQIKEEYGVPVGIQAVAANHFNLDNNIAELLNDSENFPKLEILPSVDGTVKVQMRSPDDYRNWGHNNLRRAFTGASRPYMASSPNEEKLREVLCWTAGLGYDELFKAYLDQIPAGLETEDAFGMTPFSWAAQNGWPHVVRLALQQAGSICARKRTSRGPAPLEAAARSKNGVIFIEFLKWLKHLENPIVNDTTTEPEEIPSSVPDLVDEDIEREIKSAARSEQTVTVRKLVEMLRDRQGDEGEQIDWLANKMVKAAKEGDLYLVKVLRSCGADVNRADNKNCEPLMGAIKRKRTKIAEYLIIQGAKDDKNVALKLAVQNSQHSTIRALLKVKPLEEGMKEELLKIATEKKDSTTLMLLKLEKGTEKLATPDDLDSSVDELFEATIVDFTEDQTPEFTELTVDDLMKKEKTYFNLDNRSKFKWFHLPANNALIGKIYHRHPSLAYKVLDQKRWIKRQHEGVKGSSHARFMMPACHDFQEAFLDKKKFAYEKEDRHVVLFMPYLHWDEEKALRKRSEFIAKYLQKESSSDTSSTLSINDSTGAPPRQATVPNEKPTDGRSQRDQKLLETYLLSESDHAKNSRHLLHIRRTLDQFLYHNLKDTKTRDADQTVRRYQSMDKLSNEGQLTVMVDQLWLWILLGPSGKAQAVVTCFPSRDWFDVEETGSTLDPRRTTDVLQTTKSYIQQRPDAVKTPYDLAGVIASRCSRALLDHSTDMLDFTEVYENSISYIMNEEVLLFNTFNHLMQTRTKAMEKLQAGRPSSEENAPREDDSCLANDIVKDIESLKDHPEDLKKSKSRCKEYREYTLDTEIPDEDEIKGSRRKSEDEKQRLTKLFEKFGRFFVLDITREISLLRQIKDIQDELEMMERVFSYQKEVIEAMDRIIRAMIQSKVDPEDDMEIEISSSKFNLRRGSNDIKREADYKEEIHDFLKEYKWSNTTGLDTMDDQNSAFEDEHLFAYEQQGYLDQETQKRKEFLNQAQSIVWQFRHQKQNLPLRTVNRFAEQINKMIERAKNTNTALSTLVDLKQKQNNMIDTRTARLQAEQSHKMAKESERQGRTLMVFTVVTIVFLPLSFIAAFFAIPVKEFSNNFLTLDFVSRITFPISAATSLLFIVIGFAASEWEWVREKIDERRPVPTQRPQDSQA